MLDETIVCSQLRNDNICFVIIEKFMAFDEFKRLSKKKFKIVFVSFLQRDSRNSNKLNMKGSRFLNCFDWFNEFLKDCLIAHDYFARFLLFFWWLRYKPWIDRTMADLSCLYESLGGTLKTRFCDRKKERRNFKKFKQQGLWNPDKISHFNLLLTISYRQTLKFKIDIWNMLKNNNNNR